jgi:hypothetical protein
MVMIATMTSWVMTMTVAPAMTAGFQLRSC